MSGDILSIQRTKVTVTPRELIFKYIRYLPWVVISVAILLMLAYIKLRYSTPIYSVSGRSLLTRPRSNGGGEKCDDIFMMEKGDRINDEIESIKSRSMAARVVRALRLQKQVYNKGTIRSTVIHPRELPFNFEILSL